MVKKYISTGLIAFGFVLSVGVIAPAHVGAQSTSAQAQIDALLAQIQQLQALIAQLKGDASVGNCVNLSAQMTIGSTDASTGGQVTQLQTFLQNQGYFTYAGPKGYYGLITANAVGKYQVDHGIVSSTGSNDAGIIGPMTRSAMACSGSTNVHTPTVSVSLSPTSVPAGQSSLLRWSSTNAKRCILRYGSSKESISMNGSKTVAPLQSTTYLVWCANDPGTGKDGPAASASATLTVSAASLAVPSITLQASPTTIGAVQNSTLSWSAVNAKRCVLQYGLTGENVGVSGSKTVSPSQTTSYRLWCANDSGDGKDGPSAEKTVSVAVASPSCSLTADKSSYKYGDTITFSWTTQNATYTTFQQDTSGKDNLSLPTDKGGTSGSYSMTANVIGNPSATLLVYNHLGNGSCSVTVPVSQ